MGAIADAMSGCHGKHCTTIGSQCRQSELEERLLLKNRPEALHFSHFCELSFRLECALGALKDNMHYQC